MTVTFKSLTLAIVGAIGLGMAANAAELQLSIGVRETQAGGGASGGPIFSNGGASGGIEYVNLDGQSLTVGGGWQLFTFTPSTDTLTAFAGATANSVLDGEWGTLEMIRVRNIDGITEPITLQIDDLSNFDGTTTVTESFEGQPVGTEMVFQEPNFSGSTATNLVAGGTAGVIDSAAITGQQAYEFNMQFVDATDTRWARLTTFGTTIGGNPAVRLNATAGVPTISFYARALGPDTVIPEPSTVALVGLAIGGALCVRRRWS
jgi:hypothetical protein